MAVAGMNHFTVLTDDVDNTVRFYGDLLGLEPGPRPTLRFPGAWLYAGGQPILHIVGGRPRSDLKPGVIDHMAFSGKDLAATLAQLESRRIEYDCRQQVDTGLWQIFFLDPNGAKIELDFPASERTGG
jgi:catechol 2,3-dioxygenase-like lactoylglutathione lyase family enzyme